MSVELSELRSFSVLAGELHFRKASDQLFMSQPALSKQIRRLEEKVGGLLFARTRRKVALTEAGKRLLPLAERLLRDADAAMVVARKAAEGRAGTLRIGFGIATVSEILPKTILRFRNGYPDVELQMRDMSTPSQISALLAGTLDIGIVRLPIAHPELASLPLLRERLVAATPPSVPFTSTEGLATLRDRPFIFLPRSTSATFYDHGLAVCRRAGFTPHIVQEVSEMFTILNFVRAGLGVSLVPSAAVRMNVPGVRFHDLKMPGSEWRIGIAWNRHSEKLDLISTFVSTTRGAIRRKRNFVTAD
jgi:DNA-binding transcriptional LysR family regulator